MEINEPLWHREVITSEAERALRDMRTLGVLDRCYLAGGTALALQYGHRRSHDFDFFRRDGLDPEALIRKLKALDGFALASHAPDTLHATVGQTKVSFLAYPYPVLFPFKPFVGIDVADPRDIACMKLSAIASRGTKRDFVDLYVAALQFSMPRLLEWFKQKYAEVNQSLVHVLKSLMYFENAEGHPMPDMLIPLSWEEVRRFFSSQAPGLLP
jgi:hypothetical protein